MSFKNYIKPLILTILVIIVIIAVIIKSLSLLKEEAIKTHIKIAELKTNTISSQVFQTFSNIEFISNDIKKQLMNKSKKDSFEPHFFNILNTNTYIRSISILNKNNRVLYSSNKENINLYIQSNDFYPKPMFNSSILRFGNPWIGRDLDDGIEISKIDEYNKNSQSFLPILKQIKVKNEIYSVLFTINSNYFVNQNQNVFESNDLDFYMYRIDGMLLFSSNKSEKIGLYIKNPTLFEESLKKNKSSGIDIQNNIKYMSSYILTDSFPLNIAIRLNYEQNLIEWERKRETTILIITSLLLMSMVLGIILIYKYNLEKNKEIEFHKKELEDKKRFQVLFEQNIFMAMNLKSDGRIIELNSLALSFFGLANSEIINKYIWELPCWRDNDKKWLEDKISSLKKESKIEKILFPINKQNKKVVLDFKLSFLKDTTNQDIFAIAIDITQKREKEKKLRNAYVVFQNAHDGIIITDNNGIMINVNSSFSKSSGYSIDEVVGKNPNILSSGKHNERFYTNMWESIISYGFWEGEVTNKRKNNTLYIERLTINAVFDENNNITNFIGIFSDITKQKQQEKALKEQQELIYQQSKLVAMGEMIENIAHQWRQPLSFISSAVTGMQLQKELKLPCDEKDELKSLMLINESTQYLSKTIDDFRDFLKPNKVKSSINVQEALEKTLNILSSRFKNRNITIIKNLDNLSTNGIENELIQVFINILNNAKDALDKNNIKDKIIFLDVYKDNDNITIIIKDNAGGMSEDILNRVFEPYFTTKHKSQGTGIGLFMSQEIITNHMDGILTCSNENFIHKDVSYKGASFKVLLPLIHKQEKEELT